MLSRVDDESPQAAPARFVPQSQQGFTLCHVEADVQKLYRQQVKQSSRDNAAEPRTGEAQRRAANRSQSVKHMATLCSLTGPGTMAVPWLAVDGGTVEKGRQETLLGTEAAEHQSDPIDGRQHKHDQGRDEAAVVGLSDTAVNPAEPRQKNKTKQPDHIHEQQTAWKNSRHLLCTKKKKERKKRKKKSSPPDAVMVQTMDAAFAGATVSGPGGPHYFTQDAFCAWRLFNW